MFLLDREATSLCTVVAQELEIRDWSIALLDYVICPVVSEKMGSCV